MNSDSKSNWNVSYVKCTYPEAAVVDVSGGGSINDSAPELTSFEHGTYVMWNSDNNELQFSSTSFDNPTIIKRITPKENDGYHFVK